MNYNGRCFTISQKELLINEEIRDKEVRCIDADGAQLGIISVKEAMQIATEKNLEKSGSVSINRIKITAELNVLKFFLAISSRIVT